LDYLEGGDLRKHMNEKIFNLKEIKFVAACIIIGLEYIHKKGIIHRDIKPENLIFDDKGFLRLSDFGISINNETISKREKNNDKSGTPGYMAPERIINDKNISYGYSSDFFSLGVILYELAMLNKPFRRKQVK
jgi:serum/glucocorticoid-regulated kinase 2